MERVVAVGVASANSMKQESFSVSQVLKLGFNEFRQKPTLYASVALTHTILLSLLPFVLQDLSQSEVVVQAGMFYSVVISLLNVVLQLYGGLIFTISVTYFFLKIVDHPRTRYEEIFRYHKVILRYVSLLLRLYIPGILLFFCFIIPGVIWFTRRSFALYFLLEQKITAQEAMEKSKKITQGNLMKIIWYEIAVALLSLIPIAIINSIVTSIVGINYAALLQGSLKYTGFAVSGLLSLVIMPVSTLSSIYIYKILQGKKVT